jgi:hypothetical protein
VGREVGEDERVGEALGRRGRVEEVVPLNCQRALPLG